MTSIAHSITHSYIASAVSSSMAKMALVKDPTETPSTEMESCCSGMSAVPSAAVEGAEGAVDSAVADRARGRRTTTGAGERRPTARGARVPTRVAATRATLVMSFVGSRANSRVRARAPTVVVASPRARTLVGDDQHTTRRSPSAEQQISRAAAG